MKLEKQFVWAASGGQLRHWKVTYDNNGITIGIGPKFDVDDEAVYMPSDFITVHRNGMTTGDPESTLDFKELNTNDLCARAFKALGV